MIMAILLTCGQQKRLIRTLLLTTCYCDTFLIDVMSNFISLTKPEFVEFHVQNSFKTVHQRGTMLQKLSKCEFKA